MTGAFWAFVALVLGAWLVVSVLGGLVVGKGIHHADEEAGL